MQKGIERRESGVSEANSGVVTEQRREGRRGLEGQQGMNMEEKKECTNGGEGGRKWREVGNRA